MAVVAVFATGCASLPDMPELRGGSAPDCRVAPAAGDVAALRRASGQLVVVGSSMELLSSLDGGRRWSRDQLPLDCRWPDVAEVGERLVVSCAEPRPPARLLVLVESPGGGWERPIEVATTSELMIDTCLQALSGDEVLLFATHVDRPKDLDHAVYTLQLFRSRDGGRSWSGPKAVEAGRRGRHLEDTRTTVLSDGSLLLLHEHERAEGKPSILVQHRSSDNGGSWSAAYVVWRGSDLEPGGYVTFSDGELWLIASSDAVAGQGSYERALILMRRSADDGVTWGRPQVLVGAESQLSFGGVLLPGDEVLLPSVRFYSTRGRRELALYVVPRDRPGEWRCALDSMFGDGFETGDASQWVPLPESNRR